MTRHGQADIHLQLAELRERIRELGQCPTQVMLLEQAVQLADAANDVATAFELRNELIDAAMFTGFPEKVLVAFAWNLAQADRTPEQFSESALLWKYKWVISCLFEFPQITISQMENALADMSRRFERNGASLRPVHTLRCRIYQNVGDAARVKPILPLWKKGRRDQLADCQACDRDNLVETHIFLKQYRRALQVARPLLECRMRCAAVPHITFALVLVPLLRLGRLKEAVDCHRQGFDMVKEQATFLREISQHLLFLVLLPDLNRAAKAFECHLRFALETQSPLRRYDFFRAALFMLLQMLKKSSSQRKFRLPQTFPLWQESGSYDLAALANWFETEVRTLARQFDARNGNTYRTDEVEELADLEELVARNQ